MRFFILPFLGLAAADYALYEADSGYVNHVIEGRNVNCKAVTGILAVLKGLGKPATTFCSSYLQIGTKTVTSFITPAPVDLTVVNTVTVTVVTIAPVNRRDPDPNPTYQNPYAPAALKAFAAAEISSACKCLNIPSATSGVTLTLAAPINTITGLATVTNVVTTCAAFGQPCNCFRPQNCCGGACSCNAINGGGPVSTCFDFFGTAI